MRGREEGRGMLTANLMATRPNSTSKAAAFLNVGVRVRMSEAAGTIYSTTSVSVGLAC